MNERVIFEFWQRSASAGTAVALVTISAVSGSSMRAPGTHMVVAADGRSAGSISAGCVERAIVAEALDALRRDSPREVRFGAGSPFIDIRLPCGGSLDVLIHPAPDAALADQAIALLDHRTPFVLCLPLNGGPAMKEEACPDWSTRRDATTFAIRHLPPLAIAVVGHGAIVPAMVDLSIRAGATARVFTHDADLLDELTAARVPVRLLTMPDERVDLRADPWTAVPFFFHDHDWETTLIAEALAGPAFYVGAMGSRATQERRLATLRARGVPDHRLERLRAPIGLIHSSRDPEVLALSTLTEIVRDWQAVSSGPDLMAPGAAPWSK